jgi:hypothetical protein
MLKCGRGRRNVYVILVEHPSRNQKLGNPKKTREDASKWMEVAEDRVQLGFWYYRLLLPNCYLVGHEMVLIFISAKD